MQYQDLFDQFDANGKLYAGAAGRPLGPVPWAAHPAFAGVQLKPLVTAAETGGAFSYHLVRIQPGCEIGLHTHDPQLETHEVIAGAGVCECGGQRIGYQPGVVAILPAGVPHKVTAGPEGLCLFAKFMPALV